MRNKIFPAIMIAVVVLIGPSVAAQEAKKPSPDQTQEKIQSRPPATIERLGRLDSQVEILKKQLEIRELQNKIMEAEGRDDKIRAEAMAEAQAQARAKAEQRQKNFRQRLEQMGSQPAPAEQNSAPARKIVPEQRRVQPASKKSTEEKEFRRFIANARIVSVSGMNSNIIAEIKLPNGGSLSVTEGQDCGQLGKVKTVSRSNVVLTRNKKNFNIPFSEQFKEFQIAVTQPSKDTGASMDPLDNDSGDIAPPESSCPTQ